VKAYKIIKIPERVSVYAEGKYQLKYPVGSIVFAPEGTLGIMCFSSKEHALKFLGRRGLLVGTAEGTLGIMCFSSKEHALKFLGRRGLLVGTAIIEVEGMGGALFPKEVAWLNIKRYIDEFYKLKKAAAKPPPGTVCFQKVQVLS